MVKNQEGMLIVLSGPSGAGKDTVLRHIVSQRKDVEVSISYTTRSPRKGEHDGVDYRFIDKEDFKKIVDVGGMLEYAVYCDNYYGTPIHEIDKNLNIGKKVFLEIEVQGAKQVLKKFPNAISIFIIPPSLNELYGRLCARGLDDVDAINKRIMRAKQEIGYACDYKYIVVNDDIEKCVDNIIKILDVESMKTSRMSFIIDEVLRR